jgi:hypothetical protein
MLPIKMKAAMSRNEIKQKPSSSAILFRNNPNKTNDTDKPTYPKKL